MSNQASVTDLICNFASACRALVPNLDHACVPWADGQQYDNWDRIAEALFESLVLEPCRLQVEASFPEMRLTLARYGFPPSGESAFLCLDPGAEGEGRFIRLLSVKDPFDCCEGVAKGDKAVRLVSKVELSLVIMGANGARHDFNSVALDL